MLAQLYTNIRNLWWKQDSRLSISQLIHSRPGLEWIQDHKFEYIEQGFKNELVEWDNTALSHNMLRDMNQSKMPNFKLMTSDAHGSLEGKTDTAR